LPLLHRPHALLETFRAVHFTQSLGFHPFCTCARFCGATGEGRVPQPDHRGFEWNIYPNDALYFQGASNAGTGVFPSFVQVGAANKDIVSGYNTTVNNVLDNKSDDTHNHEILTSDLPITILNGNSYFKFKLDINEVNNSVDKYLSLDSLKIYTSTVPNQSVTNPDDLGTLRYDMGAGNGVLLNYDLEAGSGFSDLVVYIPVWTNAVASQYVYLYSKFGAAGINPAGGPAGNYGNSDGFEEWAMGNAGPGETDGGPSGGPTVVPAPGGLMLLASALPFVFGLRRRLTRREPAAA